eukprot:Gregarina_sp_Poly_1__10840@NODE_83_length_15529_cov_95_045531_g71_i0_p6_GENE_NODE_83_length_15529_cov_95_045531_g71_i0NODE_83_length_15529_cov_95_045531_g71_i0_p6_ORF_typecomplete_len269_score36_76zfC2HC5/PF06221_13/5_9e15zfUBP/PF02148_19/5_1_NODE_83_length_15529_cov_95_045531_g71_i01026111067
MTQFVDWALTEFAALLCTPKSQLDASQIDILSQFESVDDLADYLSGFIEGETSYSDARTFAIKYFAKKNSRHPSASQSVPSFKSPSPRAASPTRSAEESEDSAVDEQSLHRPEDASFGEVVSVKQRGFQSGPFKKRQQPTRRRIYCSCNATEHRFVWNCVECGKIMCEAEGPGPCLFCGAASREDKREKKAWAAYEAIPGYEEAKALVTKLVEFDRDAVKRTEVKDMETDFYAEKQNPWATETQRQWANFQDLLSRQTREFKPAINRL